VINICDPGENIISEVMVPST